MDYRYANLSSRASAEIRRLEAQLSRDVGKPLLLLAYEPDAAPEGNRSVMDGMPPVAGERGMERHDG